MDYPVDITWQEDRVLTEEATTLGGYSISDAGCEEWGSYQLIGALPPTSSCCLVSGLVSEYQTQSKRGGTGCPIVCSR
jgi:hypothetical protein